MRALEPCSQVCQPRFEYEYEYRPCGAEYEYEPRQVPAGDLSVTVFLGAPPAVFIVLDLSARREELRGKWHSKR